MRPAIAFKSTLFAGALLLAAVLIAGCGSGGGSGSSDSTTALPATIGQGAGGASKCGLGNGKAASGEPIPVGAIAEMSGGPGVAQGTAAAGAYFDCVNANGGIGGRPIKFLTFDSAYNPQKAAQGAEKLIHDDNVVAFAGGASFLDCLVNGQIYEEEDVYSISGIAGPPECNGNSHLAAVDNGKTDWIGAAKYAIDNLGAKKLAIVVAKAGTIAEAVIETDTAYAEEHGAEVVKAIKIDPGLTDATSVVLDIAAAKPEAVIVASLQQDALTVLKAAQAQGLTESPKWVCLALCYSSNLPELLGSAWDGLAIETPFPLVDSKGADITLFNQVMAKYASGEPLDPFSQGGFLAAQIFTNALLGMKGPINRQTVGPVLAGIKDYKTEMLCTPWSFGTESVTAVRYIQLSDGGFEEAAGCTPVLGG
ncbi:MAG TPA: ABC transporter substrate-binding protein [Solirubrobacterales bacterium]|jgi:branched-chain amino acid transport system substrate-binding protein